MKQHLHEFQISTQGAGAHDFTTAVVQWVAETEIDEGLLTLQIRHTSASLMIQENYDPDVTQDMERFFQRLVPYGDPIFRHTSEGPDDMPAHVRSALTHTTVSIPVRNGRPTLGTWQGIYLYEHRNQAHQRRISAHLMGE